MKTLCIQCRGEITNDQRLDDIIEFGVCASCYLDALYESLNEIRAECGKPPLVPPVVPASVRPAALGDGPSPNHPSGSLAASIPCEARDAQAHYSIRGAA